MMRTKKAELLGMVLIVLGAMSLVFGEIRYPSRAKILEVGSFKAGVEIKKTLRIHPAIGIAMLCGGAALLARRLRMPSR